MNETMKQAAIEADPTVRSSASPGPSRPLRPSCSGRTPIRSFSFGGSARTGMTTTLDRWDASTGGSWRYVAARDGMEFGFLGCFPEVRPDRIVQTFAWEGEPDGVALETLTFEDLGDGRTRLRAQSVCDSLESRDAWLRGGMEVGVDEGYAKLDALLAAGEIAGTAEGALA